MRVQQAITTTAEGVKPPVFKCVSPGVILAFIGLVTACGPIIDPAPFAVRPGRARAGDLLGPFDGLIIDGETDRPISEATVEATWAFERGVGFIGPDGANSLSMITTEDGLYRFPALKELPAGGSGRVRRFTLIVYKRGFEIWRSDRVFPSGETRRDFTQHANRIRLRRWQSGTSHARHVVFMGGGDAVRKAAEWETQAAGIELGGERDPWAAVGDFSGPGKRRLFDASIMLTDSELRQVTGYAGKLVRERLADLPRTEFYDTVHFRAESEGERDDVAVRVWKLGEDAASEQYQELVTALGTAEGQDEVGDNSVRISTADIRALIFILRDAGVVVSVTCGKGQCAEIEPLIRLGKLIEGRAAELVSTPVGEKK